MVSSLPILIFSSLAKLPMFLASSSTPETGEKGNNARPHATPLPAADLAQGKELLFPFSLIVLLPVFYPILFYLAKSF